MVHSCRIVFALLGLLVLSQATGCDRGAKKSSLGELSVAPQAAFEIVLFDHGQEDWRVADEIIGNASAQFTEEGYCRIFAGRPISGIRYAGPWQLPVNHYEIKFEARRVKGSDFFAALTFPVHSLQSCATFIPGGWGGAVTGISCIDGIDASANETTSTYTFREGKWHAFRIEVLPDTLKAWRDDAIILNVPLAGKEIGLRHGDIEHCAPFGLASYQTTGEIRNLSVRKLDDEPIWRTKSR